LSNFCPIYRSASCWTNADIKLQIGRDDRGESLAKIELARNPAKGGAIALAAASALDLAADLGRRSSTLIAVAPKLRPKTAQKIVDLMLAQDCLPGRSRPPRADDRPRRPPPVRQARLARRRAPTHRPVDVSAVRPMSAAARRRQRSGDESLDVELIDLPPAARWRE
jgi:hypothetical protein